MVGSECRASSELLKDDGYMTSLQEAQLMQDVVTRVNFRCRTSREQVERGGRSVFDMRRLDSISGLLTLPGVMRSIADQCQHDRKRPAPRPARRGTKFMTNSVELEHKAFVQVWAWAS